MQRKQKLIMATAILACGLTLAMFFRKHDLDQSLAAVAENEVSEFALQADAERIQYVAPPGEAVEEPPAAAAESTASQTPAKQLLASELKSIERPGSPAAPPTIAQKYERQLFALAETRSVASAPIADQPPPVARPPAPRLRSHRINDGDTLETLARRYLGDATRWGEIYEANRSLLGDPFQLPIGASLTIPPREKVAVQWPSIRAQRAPQLSIMAPTNRRSGQVISHSRP